MFRLFYHEFQAFGYVGIIVHIGKHFHIFADGGRIKRDAGVGTGGPTDAGFGIDEVNDLAMELIAFFVFGKVFCENSLQKFSFICLLYSV